jgi:hypothetical protein
MSRSFGALFFMGPQDITPSAVGTSAGQYALLLDANNIPYWGNTAGVATVNFASDSSYFNRPFITYPSDPGQYSTASGVIPTSSEFKNIYGTGAGGPGDPFSGLTPGSPTATPTATLPTPQFGTPPIPWGIAFKDIFVVYSVQTASLTSATVSLIRVTFSNNVAYASSIVVPTTQLTLPLTATTSALTPYVQVTSLVQPINYEAIDYSNLNLTFTVATAATSAVRLYGMGYHAILTYS